MKRSTWVWAVAATFAVSALADHHEKKMTDVKAEAAEAKSAMPEKMSPEQEKMMKAWEAAGKVTENHKNLSYLEGEWNITAKFWQAPDAKPEESTGKSRIEPVMGGRFMHEAFNSTMMGQPFQGTSYIGYDNTKNKYVTLWMDNMSTGMFRFEGESKDKGKTIVSTSQFMCPLTGQPKDVRQVMKRVGKNKVVVEHFEKFPATGKEFKAMEVVYTRG